MFDSLQLLQPTTIAEASSALAEYGEGARIYAGGAELLLLIRQRMLDAEVLIDIKKISRLKGVSRENGSLRIGACVTHSALAHDAQVREHAAPFAYAESQVANIRVRNQGTLGGNLCFNDPHSDPGTVLLTYDASVTVGSASGERKMPLSEFFVDMYATAVALGEILLDVEIPPLPAGMKSTYLRLHRYQRPTLGVAAAVKLKNGAIEDVRLAVGCVSPKAQRLTELEEKLSGAALGDGEKIIMEQKKPLRDLLRPVDDLLGSAEYKLYMTGVFLRDALRQAAAG
ncbi:MAG TPA: xanthine dehydrogenase family protein subunit M [Candidatus Binatia bacterium]|jgi:carbon-monoxide dehydrogenase medium subunit